LATVASNSTGTGAITGAFPVLANHDEIVVECDQEQAEPAQSWLKAAMLDGMAPFACFICEFDTVLRLGVDPEFSALASCHGYG